jgi:hypothetical protein
MMLALEEEEGMEVMVMMTTMIYLMMKMMKKIIICKMECSMKSRSHCRNTRRTMKHGRHA